MSNYIEHNDTIAFHPGYYIQEIIDASDFAREDFAQKLSTTPKCVNDLINGEQDITVDMATKLSEIFGTSVNYWLNLQKSYDISKT